MVVFMCAKYTTDCIIHLFSCSGYVSVFLIQFAMNAQFVAFALFQMVYDLIFFVYIMELNLSFSFLFQNVSNALFVFHRCACI